MSRLCKVLSTGEIALAPFEDVHHGGSGRHARERIE
jgi:hypothetical protein